MLLHSKYRREEEKNINENTDLQCFRYVLFGYITLEDMANI